MKKLVNKKVVFIITIIAMFVAILGVAFFTNASTKNPYVIEIMDEGQNAIVSNKQLEISQKIVRNESDDTKLVYELNTKNVLERKQNIEVAIVIDSSYSMRDNAQKEVITNKIGDLAAKIINDVPRSKISLCDNSGRKTALITNTSSIGREISNIVYGTGSSLTNGVQNANNTFSTTPDTQKYLLLVTDSTDNVEDSLISITDNNVGAISILYDMTNNAMGTPDDYKYGPVYMMDSFNADEVVDYINKNITQITLNNMLTPEILQSFDVTILSYGNHIQNPQVNANGISYTIDRLENNTTQTIKYQLTFKENVFIDRNVVYKTWHSSTNVKANYTMDNLLKEVTLEQANTPTFTVCETYDMKVKAVNAENTSLGVAGIQFKIKGTDDSGNQVYEQTLTTDGNGYVKVEKIKTLGKVTYSISPVINIVGYEATPTRCVIVDNDYLGRRVLTIDSDGLEANANTNDRIVEVEFPIKVQGFDLEVNLNELNNSNVKLSNTEFRLIQPKLNNKYEMDALYGRTNADGQVFFHPAVMTKAGTYDYILSQMDEVTGYQSMGNVTLRLTFNAQGEITETKVKYNDKVEVVDWNTAYVKLNVGNESDLSDAFDFELNLKDKYTQNPIVGAKYTVEVTTSNNKRYRYGDNVTDNNGQIHLALPGSGEVHISIVEQSPAVGYANCTIAKEFTIHRQDGEVKYAYGSNESSTNYFTVTCQSVDDKVIVDTEAILKQERNTVKIKAVDAMEIPTFGLEGVEFSLVNTVNGKVYGPEQTNFDGELEFTIDEETNGQYEYNLIVSAVPFGYLPITNPIRFNIFFDGDGYIDHNINPIDTVRKMEYQPVEDETAKLHRAYIEIGLDMDSNLAYTFEIDLSDIDTNVPIDGAMYDIDIKCDGNIIKTITDRPTDTNGKVYTRVAIDSTRVTELEFEVAQKKSKVGYRADIGSQEIVIDLRTGVITHTPTEVIRGSGNPGQVRHATKNGKNIKYEHTNRKKNANDIILNVNITTEDKLTGALVGGKSVTIINEPRHDNGRLIQILNSDGSDLNVTKPTSIDSPTEGFVSFEDLPVLGNVIPGEQDYELDILVDNHLVRLNLIYAYNEDKEQTELITAEVIYGNRLIKDNGRNYTSYENEIGYISDLNLVLYSIEELTGNLILDLKKADIETKDSRAGAKYDIIIERPDGTRLVQKDVEIFENVVELDGIYVPQGSDIYITETEAPLGYKLNNTIRLTVTDVDVYTNEVTLTQIDGAGESKLERKGNIPINDGMVKSVYTLDMYDAQEDKFQFKITTTDNDTFNGVGGYKFEIKNDAGSQATTGNTDNNGETNVLIGGIYDDTRSPKTYTITGIQAGMYYKKLKDPIEVQVYFKADGTVDYAKTLQGQTDSNYSLTGTDIGQWHFEGANKLDSKGNIEYCIAIIINVEQLDPLKVEIETVNKFTDKPISNVEYEITPSVGVANGISDAQGMAKIEVNYAESNINRSYVINQKTVPDEYIAAQNLAFNITYDGDGNIASQPIVVSDEMKVVSYQDKTIRLQVAIEPRVPIVVTNLYYFDRDEVLQGGEFRVTGMSSSLQTNSDGKAKGLIEKYGENEDVTYTITQTKARFGYAEVDPFNIVVHYNENREITSVILEDPDNRFVTVSHIQPSSAADYGYNKTDKGIIVLTVLNYKAVTMNIENVDRQDPSKPLQGTTYSITSDINTSGGGTTDQNGIATTYVGKCGFDKTVRYTIREEKPAFGYQTFGTYIYLDVDFNAEGYITGCTITNNPRIDNIATVNKVTPIVTIEDNFTINIQLKNNPLMKFNITKVDSQDETRVIKDVTFDVIGTLGETQYTKDTITTDVLGKAIAKVDRTLDNQTMEYTIKEIKKSPFYEWLPEDIKLEIAYDATGKMQKVENACRVTAGNQYIKITNVDEDNFTIDMTIYNDEIKAFGVHIYTDDVYDNTKKVENATWEAWLTDRGLPGHAKDNKYATTLISGRDSDNDGNPDLAHAEDYQIIGEYSEGTGTRTLRLTTNSNSMPNRYSLNDEWIESAYGLGSYNILMDIDFDDNGKIVNPPRLRTGYDGAIGWLLDKRYVEVTQQGDYGVNVHIHYYPYLQVALRSYDMYTGDYTPANFRVSTVSSQGDITGIKSGYIGSYPGLGKHYKMDYRAQPKNQISINNFKPFCFTETTDARITKDVLNDNGETVTVYGSEIYLYEMDEPLGYQKYRPRYLTDYYQRKLAKIVVWYNDKGEVVDADVSPVYSHNNIQDINVIIPEYGKYAGEYDANGNFVRYNDHNIYIDVTYAPITTAQITVKDAVSDAPIGGVRACPYGGDTSQTKTSYEYITTLSYPTNNNGQASWTYWGANVADGKNIYKISLENIKAGYLGSIKKDESAFSFIEVEVSYGPDGRISFARVLNRDGFDNIAAEVDESCYGSTQLKLIFKLQRKMGMQINKVDKYDNNIAVSAKFKITNNIDTSGTHTDYIIKAGKTKQIAGRIIANNTVEYTLSEVAVQDGYKPLDQNLKLIVKYRADGTIDRAYPGDAYSSQYLRVDNVCQTPRKDNSLLEKDIEITIVNTPKVAVELELQDKFYSNIKIDNVTFRMENSEGEVGVGNLVTDDNGKIYTYIGEVHPGKTVKYTLTQESKADGYYKLTKPIEFTVTFDNTGKPVDKPTLVGAYEQEYSQMLTNDLNKFRDDYTVDIIVYNMPEKVNLAIKKYDELDNKPIQGVEFKVTVEENGTSHDINNILTDGNGNAIVQIDTFREETQGRSVIYNVHEVEAPDSYRKTKDFQIQVFYEAKGGISAWQVLSNDSNLDYTIYKRGNTSIEKVYDTYAHMKLEIPNDNTYDIIVKDEDINYNGLGIKGTQYDMTINGVPKDLKPTSNTGETTLTKLTENGDIQIRIAERVMGEGYRENNENDVILEIKKAATGAYSLSLDTSAMINYTINPTANSTTSVPEYKVELTDNTYVIVSVDEGYGEIKVTFFNETKSELTLIKQDINTKKVLSDVAFKVVTKDLGTQAETVITESQLTDANGEIYFDLGVAPQNTTVEYTFIELAQPEPHDIYQVILVPQTVTVTYDIYGKIANMTTKSSLRTKALLEHNDENCRSIITTIGNGTIDPQYTVKVVSEDVDTGRRINGSVFDVEVNKTSNGDTLTELNSGTTNNLCIDGKLNTDAAVENGGLKVIEKGVVKTEGMKYKGEIIINVSQTGFADGYIAGSQKVAGQVRVTTNFTDNPNGSMDSILSMDVQDNDGLEVTLDENAREIIITVKNESRLQLTLEKLSAIPNEDGTRNPIKGATFTITSQILKTSGPLDTDLNVQTRQTGVDGITSETIGKTYPKETVVYTIHEDPIPGYKPIEDIKIAVVYDLKGNITYVELLSAYIDILNWTDIVDSFKGTRDIRIPVLNIPIVDEYQIVLEKHDIEDELYPQLIPGAEYEITVEEQFGETRTWRAMTNTEGKIISKYFNGYGTINITIQEIDAPLGYQIDPTIKYIVVTRNKDSGIIKKYSSDVNIDINDEYTVVTLKPVDKATENTYGLIIDKIDIDTGFNIVEDTAEFEVTITKQEVKEEDDYQEPDDLDIDEETEVDTDVDSNEEVKDSENESEDANNEGTNSEEAQEKEQQIVVTYKDTLEKMTTVDGKAMRRTIFAPEEEGIYTYTIKETKVPNGYQKDPQEVVFEVEFVKNEERNMVIKNVTKISGEYASIFVVRENALGFKLGNKNEKFVVKDDEYALNIYKVDEEGNRIKGDAIFKVTMPDGTIRYVETDENSRLNLEHFKLPEQATTETFVIEEVMPPEGYIANKEPITIDLGFTQDENEKIILKESDVVIDAPGENVLSEEIKEREVNINVKNEPGAPVIDEDRGNYNIILTKIDADTKQIIPKQAEFMVGLENGQRILSRTKEDGKIKILDIKTPALPGEYEYVIKETMAPEGYQLNDEPQIFKVTFAKDPQDPTKLVITDAKVVTDGITTSIIEITSYANNTVEINVENEKDESDEPEEYVLNIYKVDEEGNRIKGNAIFKVTMPDGTTRYVETDENSRLKLERFKVPEQARMETFVIQEVMPPEGFIINKEPITIDLGFTQDENKKVILKESDIAINAPGDNVLNAYMQGREININVKNVPGKPVIDEDRGNYNIILTKIDADTKQIISKQAEFTVGLENGQRVLDRTKEDGKIKILDIKMPALPGEYEYVIKETMAPEGYKLNDEPQVFKITFEEDPQDPTKLVITDAKEVTNDTTTSIIEVTSYTNNTVEINVENEKTEPKPKPQPKPEPKPQPKPQPQPDDKPEPDDNPTPNNPKTPVREDKISGKLPKTGYMNFAIILIGMISIILGVTLIQYIKYVKLKNRKNNN